MSQIISGDSSYVVSGETHGVVGGLSDTVLLSGGSLTSDGTVSFEGHGDLRVRHTGVCKEKRPSQRIHVRKQGNIPRTIFSNRIFLVNDTWIHLGYFFRNKVFKAYFRFDKSFVQRFSVSTQEKLDKRSIS